MIYVYVVDDDDAADGGSLDVIGVVGAGRDDVDEDEEDDDDEDEEDG